MNTWILICNTNYFNIKEAFTELDMITWPQLKNAAAGDVVYIYAIAPYRAVLYRCKIEEINLHKMDSETIPYVMSPMFYDSEQTFMRMAKLREYPEDLITEEEIRNQGLSGLQSTSLISKEFSEYIRKKEKSISKAKKAGRILRYILSIPPVLVLLVIVFYMLNPDSSNTELPSGDNMTETQSVATNEDKEQANSETNIYDEPVTEEVAKEDTDLSDGSYVGYLDEYSQWDFASYFANKDYDGDGKSDRVYQSKYDTTIEFGNGTKLYLAGVEGVESMMSSLIVENADLTDREKDEIIVLSNLVPYSTGYQCYGMLSIYGWDGNSYKDMKLPFTNGIAYVKYEQLDDNTLQANVLGTDYSCEIDVSDNWDSAESYMEFYGDVTEEHPTWQVYLRKSGGLEQLVCRVNLLSHKDAEGLEISLKYQGGKFEIDNIVFFENNYNSGLATYTEEFGKIERI